MTSIRTSPSIATLVALVAACSQPAPPQTVSPAAPVDTVFVVDTVMAESGIDPALEDQIARLQIELIGREVQIEGLVEQLDGTRQELVRTMAKLQSQATRAEAASGMAEAEIALGALGRLPGGSELPEFAQAGALIAQSTVQFTDDNFGGALYLATEARSLARTGQSRLRGGAGGSLYEGEALFALPVPLQTVSRSNVREGPGLSYGITHTLDGGETIVGQSHTSQWVRVQDDEGREGWIFHTLVTGRPR